MSVQSFIPTIWEGKLLANYSKESITELITTKPMKIEGNKITFNRVGAGNVKDYDGTVSWDEVNTTPIELNMDQKKYFAFSVDDVDKVQAAGDLVDSYTAEEATKVKEEIDTFTLGFYTEAHADNVIGTDVEPVLLDVGSVYNYIVDLGTKLNKKKVPKANRFVIIESEVLGLLSKDSRFTANPTVLENGVVEGQKINGMQVVVSEELHSTGGVYKIMALHKSAVGFGKQIDKTEAMRLQNTFADGVRGLVVYGAEVLRPEGLAVLTAGIANQ